MTQNELYQKHSHVDQKIINEIIDQMYRQIAQETDGRLVDPNGQAINRANEYLSKNCPKPSYDLLKSTLKTISDVENAMMAQVDQLVFDESKSGALQEAL